MYKVAACAVLNYEPPALITKEWRRRPDRYIEGQGDRKTDRETNREKERQTETKTHKLDWTPHRSSGPLFGG